MSIEAPVQDNTAQVAQPSQQDVRDAVERAARRMAPLWSLRHFVAVNPYLGLTDHTFEDAAQLLAHRAGARLTAPRAFYAEAIQAGCITDEDLKTALSAGNEQEAQDITSLKAFALDKTASPNFEVLPPVADVAGSVWADLMVESISRWASAYFDLGQSYWRNPWRDLSPYAAWRAEAAIDRTADLRGLQGFRQTIVQLPALAEDTIEAALELLDVPNLDAYLHRLFLSINGWASYARFQLWDAELHSETDSTMTELLAIRLAWEVGLYHALDGLAEKWHIEKAALGSAELDANTQASLAGELALQYAFENAFQRELFSKLGSAVDGKATTRKGVQAAFCIDVRSEVFRRAFESVSDSVETIGFAGFFGFPIEYVRLGEKHGSA